jgi:hypothetical protein
VINGLRVAFDCDLYITGSNAKMLSGELATYLSGRYVEIPVLPLSFQEFIRFKHSDASVSTEELFRSYLETGSFPSVALLENSELTDTVLQGIFDSILLKDVSLRGNIKDTSLLLRIVAFLFDAAGSPVSSNSIAHSLTSAGRKTSNETVEKYLELLTDAFIFYQSKRFDIRGKEQLKTLSKYYPVDPGLRNCITGRNRSNWGQQIENVVYLELIRRGYQVSTGKMNDQEIDFVCTRQNQTLYVQVAWELPRKSDRETGNLLRIPDNHEQILITGSKMDSGTIDGIRCIYIIDFLLDDSY